MRLTVVSWPATTRRKIIASTSSALKRSEASSACTSADEIVRGLGALVGDDSLGVPEKSKRARKGAQEVFPRAGVDDVARPAMKSNLVEAGTPSNSAMMVEGIGRAYS